MVGARITEVVALVLKQWDQRLAWVLVDRDDNDFIYHVGIDGFTKEDELVAAKLEWNFNPACDDIPYSYGFWATDAKNLEKLGDRIRQQFVFRRDALGVPEQAATTHV